MSEYQVFVTDFGVVRIGPKFGRRVAQLSADLKRSKRTKLYKCARREMDRLEVAVAVLADLEWRDGFVLQETP